MELLVMGSWNMLRSCHREAIKENEDEDHEEEEEEEEETIEGEFEDDGEPLVDGDNHHSFRRGWDEERLSYTFLRVFFRT